MMMINKWQMGAEGGCVWACDLWPFTTFNQRVTIFTYLTAHVNGLLLCSLSAGDDSSEGIHREVPAPNLTSDLSPPSPSLPWPLNTDLSPSDLPFLSQETAMSTHPLHTHTQTHIHIHFINDGSVQSMKRRSPLVSLTTGLWRHHLVV